MQHQNPRREKRQYCAVPSIVSGQAREDLSPGYFSDIVLWLSWVSHACWSRDLGSRRQALETAIVCHAICQTLLARRPWTVVLDPGRGQQCPWTPGDRADLLGTLGCDSLGPHSKSLAKVTWRTRSEATECKWCLHRNFCGTSLFRNWHKARDAPWN